MRKEVSGLASASGNFNVSHVLLLEEGDATRGAIEQALRLALEPELREAAAAQGWSPQAFATLDGTVPTQPGQPTDWTRAVPLEVARNLPLPASAVALALRSMLADTGLQPAWMPLFRVLVSGLGLVSESLLGGGLTEAGASTTIAQATPSIVAWLTDFQTAVVADAFWDHKRETASEVLLEPLEHVLRRLPRLLRSLPAFFPRPPTQLPYVPSSPLIPHVRAPPASLAGGAPGDERSAMRTAESAAGAEVGTPAAGRVSPREGARAGPARKSENARSADTVEGSGGTPKTLARRGVKVPIA